MVSNAEPQDILENHKRHHGTEIATAILDIKNKLAAHTHTFGRFHGVRLLLTSTLFGRPRLCTAQLAGSNQSILLRPGTSDPQVFMEVVTFGEYDFAYPTLPRHIVDLGANIGITVAWFAERFPGTHILAVEPDEENFKLLAKNTCQYPNITLRQLAVWSKPTKLALLDTGLGPWSYYTRPVDEYVEQDKSILRKKINYNQTVDGCTIDQLLNEAGIDRVDILKIDIEGSEVEIFADASAWISKVDTIVIELHENLFPGVTKIFNKATQVFTNRISRKNTIMVTRI
ncbi:MAG: FkbM family methyltransferase [Actinobacteria bacterium]|jgi:FkbM family methyltransferase|nr:FkbM family methyltransferase [Actinomycetota bacterium]